MRCSGKRNNENVFCCRQKKAVTTGRYFGSLVAKDEKKNKTTAFKNETQGALRSELSYKLLGTAQDHWLLEVNPVTGRPHQIRVQLASMGCVIKGDVKYGADEPNEDGSIYLHARRLAFVHPVKKEKVTFEAPLPAMGMWKYFSKFD
jgi:23S rRNA pseudouridine1911/1915/1917 synthase